jgi:hypothetical protein
LLFFKKGFFFPCIRGPLWPSPTPPYQEEGPPRSCLRHGGIRPWATEGAGRQEGKEEGKDGCPWLMEGAGRHRWPGAGEETAHHPPRNHDRATSARSRRRRRPARTRVTTIRGREQRRRRSARTRETANRGWEQRRGRPSSRAHGRAARARARRRRLPLEMRRVCGDMPERGGREERGAPRRRRRRRARSPAMAGRRRREG